MIAYFKYSNVISRVLSTIVFMVFKIFGIKSLAAALHTWDKADFFRAVPEV